MPDHLPTQPDPSGPAPDTTPWGPITFFRSEVGGAALLLLATAIALVWANLPHADLVLRESDYDLFWHGNEISLRLGPIAIDEDLAHWVNDGLMAIFFYVVGLEIRQELVHGELRDRRAALVPALAALAGMVVPALLFFAINAGGPAASGWGIVMATDIAFVLGALAIAGDRVSPGLRVFLLTLAIVDDIGAIAVIAVFYTSEIDLAALGGAAGVLTAIVLLRRYGPSWNAPAYVIAGLILWYLTLKSGIHPTIAGVAMGVLTSTKPTPARRRRPARPSPNERFQHRLHSISAFLVIPVFALANAGVAIGGDTLTGALTSSVGIGIVVGLVLGKLLGVSLATFGATRAGLGPLPTGAGRGHVAGAAGLAGIGFTVSLFVAELAFDDDVLVDQAKIAVLVASLIAAIVGWTILALQPKVRAERTG